MLIWLQSWKTKIFPVFIICMFCLTIIAGFIGTILPSLNYLPVMGYTEFSLSPWFDFFSWPGVEKSIFITLFSGIMSSFCVTALTFLFIAFSHNSFVWRFFEKILSPVLSIPHAAFAVGFSFLIAPSGWLIRIISPGLTGFTNPPDWIILNDNFGISLTVALIIKEFPFLVMVAMGALGQLEIKRTILTGKALGYSKEQIWLKLLIPELYPHLRLAIFGVIAYSFSVVDMAILLGPGTPPSLGLQLLKWFNDPEMGFKLIAAAGSLFLFFMVISSIGVVYCLEKLIPIFLKPWVINTTRESSFLMFKWPVILTGLFIIAITLGSCITLIIWSFSWNWRFPSSLPETWTFKLWVKGLDACFNSVMTTLITGITATFTGLVLIVGCLEHDVDSSRDKTRNYNKPMQFFLYLPLLIPQITFMTGIQLFLVIMKIDGLWITLVWSHLLFVLPYIFIALSATYLSFDQRLTDQALFLRRSYSASLFKIKLPILLKPILFAFAIGFSVSVAQYIPTMIVGAGRFSTITTQVVSIASGSDRRIMSVYALVQQSIPMIVYALAVIIPKILYFNKKGMRV